MVRALWNSVEIAASSDTVIVENNHYFPKSDVNSSYLRDSDYHTTCPWKGEASYYSLEVNGKVNKDAAWYYPVPKKGAEVVTDRIAFWKGVEIIVE